MCVAFSKPTRPVFSALTVKTFLLFFAASLTTAVVILSLKDKARKVSTYISKSCDRFSPFFSCVMYNRLPAFLNISKTVESPPESTRFTGFGIKK